VRAFPCALPCSRRHEPCASILAAQRSRSVMDQVVQVYPDRLQLLANQPPCFEDRGLLAAMFHVEVDAACHERTDHDADKPEDRFSDESRLERAADGRSRCSPHWAAPPPRPPPQRRIVEKPLRRRFVRGRLQPVPLTRPGAGSNSRRPDERFPRESSRTRGGPKGQSAKPVSAPTRP
jgi:hypothetical protein